MFIDLTPEQRAEFEAKGRKPHWRFKLDHAAGIEWDDLIRGGSGPDHPRFSIGPLVPGLHGGFGDDRVEGNGGGDLITGGPGADLLLGGGGDDQIGDPESSPVDRIQCGLGDDFVEAGFEDIVSPDCETVNRF